MATSEPKRYGTLLLWIAGLAVALGIFYAVRALTRETVGVRVTEVTTQTLSDTVSTNGTVEPIDEFQAHAPGPGVIKKIYVEVGEHVVPHQLLISMNDDDALSRFAGAKANLSASLLTLHDLEHGGSNEEHTRFGSDISAARIEQQTAENNLAQLKALQARGSVSQAEVIGGQQRLDNANLTLKTATGRTVNRFAPEDISNARARVEDSKAALAAAQAQYDALNIRTPIAGTVYSIPFSQYDYVPGGDKDILAVANLHRMRVRAYFDEPEIGRLKHGQPVDITWEARPNMTWHGYIDIAPTTVVTVGTRSVGECIVAVDDAQGGLLPNTNVTVKVTRSQHDNVLSIPREALHTEGMQKFVYRIVNGRLARQTVTTDVVNLTNVQITSGLKRNDVIVLGPSTAGRDLTDGMEVKPTP